MAERRVPITGSGQWRKSGEPIAPQFGSYTGTEVLNGDFAERDSYPLETQGNLFGGNGTCIVLGYRVRRISSGKVLTVEQLQPMPT
jgi:hypothetical protein